MQEYKELQKLNSDIYTLSYLIEFLDFDRDSSMPVGSTEFRGKQLGLLGVLVNKIYKQPRYKELLDVLSKSKNLSKIEMIDVKESYKKWIHQSSIAENLIEKKADSIAKTTKIWSDCKNKKSTLKDVLPYLQENFEITKQIADEKSKLLNLSPYDVMCDEYQSGLTTELIDKTFISLKQFLINLIKKVKNKKTIPFREYSRDKKVFFVKKLLDLMNYDWSRGRVGEVIHPCSCGMSPDTIVAINYNADPLSLTYSTMHECGHSLYTQNLTDYLSSIGQQRGMAIHESQSLFWERHIGKNENFIPILSKLFQETIGGDEFNEENILNTIRYVKPSFIRIDADEISYPLHIIMRYEIEKDIIEGKMKIKDIKEVWDSKVKEYLGIVVNNDLNGVLQDCHWYVGLIGYFPSYTFGAIIASQLFNTYQKINNICNELKDKNLKNVSDFLKEKIHNKGCEFSFVDLVKNATGDEINVNCFKKYLENRYL